MRAVVLEELGAPLRLVEQPIPVAVGSQELVKVTACGICHSDLHVAAGDYTSTLPLVLGHEVTGVHSELGPVVVYACWGCRQPNCWACESGQEMICPNSHEAGLVDDGGYAEYLVVPDQSYLVPLGELDPVRAAPLACGGLTAYRAVTHVLAYLADHQAGTPKRTLIIGAGGLGQFAVQFLRQLSEIEVVATDTAETKRHKAVALGAHLAPAPEDLEGGFDAVIDFVGAQSTLELMATQVRRQGLGVVVGLFGGRIPFGVGAVPLEARLMSSIWGTREQLSELVAHVQRHPLANPVEVVRLEDAQRAHERLAAGEVSGRLVLTP
jgi:alcohol dehydrogenase, propanol-preferring